MFARLFVEQFDSAADIFTMAGLKYGDLVVADAALGVWMDGRNPVLAFCPMAVRVSHIAAEAREAVHRHSIGGDVIFRYPDVLAKKFFKKEGMVVFRNLMIYTDGKIWITPDMRDIHVHTVESSRLNDINRQAGNDLAAAALLSHTLA